MTLPPPDRGLAALVTGASSGIGAAIAGELSRRGYTLILVARRADKLTELAGGLGKNTHVLTADLSRPDDRSALASSVAELGLGVDVLVNSAGLSTMGRIANADIAAELNQVEVDVAAVVDLTCRFVPGMVARRRGAVLNVASVGAFGPVPGQAGYGAAKAFVLSYTSALGQELRGTGVAAATLCPGPVRTEFVELAGFSQDEAEALLPPSFWRTAEQVAVAAIDGLDAGRTVIVPGRLNHLAAAATHLTPRRLLLPALGRRHPGMTR